MKPLVAQVITRAIVGGAQKTTLELCRGLRSEFRFHLICGPQTGPEGSLLSEFKELGEVSIDPYLRREINPLGDLRAVRSLRATLEELGPAVVHTHSSKAGILGRAASSRARIPVVHTVHGWGHTPDDSGVRRGLFVNLERYAARRAAALVAVSPEVRDEGLAHRIGSASQYHVIPEGVDFTPLKLDFEQGRREARATLGLTDDDEVVGWVGRFVPQKDPDTTARALQVLLGLRGEATAVIVGDGPLRARFEQIIAAAGLSERVHVLGLRAHARALMPAFDVLLHLTRWEGQPRVVQEALAERVPVVATCTPGVPGLMRDPRTGAIVDVGDAEGAAKAAAAILADRSDAAAPLDNAVLEALNTVNGTRVTLERHAALYRSVIAYSP